MAPIVALATVATPPVSRSPRTTEVPVNSAHLEAFPGSLDSFESFIVSA